MSGDSSTHDADAVETSGWLETVNPIRLPLRQQLGILAVIALGLGPFLVDDLTVLKLTSALYLGVFAMTWDFTSGYTGEISFGHAFFFASGGYTSAVLNIEFGVDPLMGIVAGVFVAAIAGLLLGGPALRLEGPYLSLVTLAAPLILYQLFIVYSDIFGGEVGLIATENLSADPVVNYYIAFALLVGALVLFFVITRSEVGQVLTAIREDEENVLAAGINPAKFKLYSFVLSAAVGGLAGGLLTHSSVGNATPTQLLALTVNINIIVATIIGGMGTIVGAAVGGIAFFMIRDFLSNVEAGIPLLDVPVADVDLVLFYIVTVLIMFWMPQGFLPWLIDRGRDLLDAVLWAVRNPREAYDTVRRMPREGYHWAIQKFRGGVAALFGGDRQ